MNICTILVSLLAAALPLKGTSSFTAGEEQVYLVHYQWGVLNADVARAYCTIDSTTLHGQPAYKARIYGKTAKFCEAIVKVREDFQSWFTASDFRPEKSRRKAQEAKFNGGETNVFDWNAGKLTITVSSNGKETVKVFDLEPGVLDVPTLFYCFRNIDLAKVSDGTPFQIKVAVGDKIEAISMKYAGRETLNARGMDKVAARKFLIMVSSGNTFDTKNAISLYASDDDVMIPLYFEAPLRLGKVVGRLESSTRKK